MFNVKKLAPTTVANFVKYAKEGFYNGTIFHRVINNFMIQGGGFDRNLHQKSTHAPIKLEDKNGLKNTVGTIAMARTTNPGPVRDGCCSQDRPCSDRIQGFHG